MDRYGEAIVCCDKALAIDSLAVEGWCLKAAAEAGLGRPNEALAHYRKFVELAPPEYAQQLALAREGIAELEASL